MELITLGWNHRSDALKERETLQIPPAAADDFLIGGARRPGIGGLVYLGTCNRVEATLLVRDGGAPEFLDYWGRFVKSVAPLRPAYCHRGGAAFGHLLRVACGLDSMVLGENEVFGQLKQAYARSLALKTSGSLLNFVFQQVLRFSKKIRSQTGISRYPVSCSTVALMLLNQVLGDLKPLKGLVIGLGEMGRQAAKMARERGVGSLWVMNRTESKAMAFAREVDAEVVPINSLAEALAGADFAITSTSSPEPVIRQSDISSLGRSTPLVLVDLGVPRDVEETLGQREEIFLYNMDDLKAIADRNRASREKEAALAEAMIGRKVGLFLEGWEKRRSLNLPEMFSRVPLEKYGGA